MTESQNGYGNTPWGGIIVVGVTPHPDGYGPMGWGNENDTTGFIPKSRAVGGLVNGQDAHLTRGHDSNRSRP